MNRFNNIQNAYEHYSQERQEFLDRFYKYNNCTVKDLLIADDSGSDIPLGYSDFPASLVETLRNKIILENFPVNDSFMKLSPGRKGRALLTKDGLDPTNVETDMQVIQETATAIFNERNYRSTLEKGVEHLVVGGNILFQKLGKEDSEKLIYYTLEEYVTSYDIKDTLRELIICEYIHEEEAIEIYGEDAVSQTKKDDYKNEMVALYHQYKLVNRKKGIYKQAKALGSTDLELSLPNIKLHKEGIFPIHWNKTKGENYARGKIERHYNDIINYHNLSEAEGIATAEMLNIKNFVETNNPDFVETINESDIGEYLSADGKISQSGNSAWGQLLAQVQNQKDKLESKLKLYFGQFDNTALQGRDRVTAEEIQLRKENERVNIQALVNLSEQFTRPISILLIEDAIAELEIEGLDKEYFDKIGSIKVKTGIDLIARNEDLDKLAVYLDFNARLNQIPEYRLKTMKLNKFGQVVANMAEFDSSQIEMSDKEITDAEQAEIDRQIEMQAQIAQQQNQQF